MTRAVRSPGSTLKPLIYGLAFEQGLAHPETLIEDRPTGFDGYAPKNFDGFHRGTVTVREALQQSLNVPAVVALDAVGPARLVARLKRAAVNAELPDQSAPGLAIGLGGVGVTLRDLVSLYAAIARGGTAVTLSDGVDDAPAALSGAPGARRRPPPGTSPTSSPACRRRSTARPAASPTRPAPPTAIATPGRSASTAPTSSASGSAGRTARRCPACPASSAPRPILFEAFDRIGPKRVPLRRAPPGVLTVSSTAALPAPLRYFRDPGQATFEQKQDDPEIAYPLDGVSVDLGIAGGDPQPLVIKVRNGAPPFTWFVNGARSRARRLPAPRPGSRTAPASSRSRWSTATASRTG